jgi:hypothetical protein
VIAAPLQRGEHALTALVAETPGAEQQRGRTLMRATSAEALDAERGSAKRLAGRLQFIGPESAVALEFGNTGGQRQAQGGEVVDAARRTAAVCQPDLPAIDTTRMGINGQRKVYSGSRILQCDAQLLSKQSLLC